MRDVTCQVAGFKLKTSLCSLRATHDCRSMFRGYKPALRLEGHTDSVIALDFSPDGLKLVSGGIDGQLFVWCTVSGKMLYNLDLGEGFLSVAWMNNTRLISGTEAGNLTLLENAPVRHTVYWLTAILTHNILSWALSCSRPIPVMFQKARLNVWLFTMEGKLLLLQKAISRYFHLPPHQHVRF